MMQKCLLPQQVMSLASVDDPSAKNADITKATAMSRAKAEKKAVKTKGMKILNKAPPESLFLSQERTKSGKIEDY